MAHVHAYGDVCPTARPIIHLGATSCYVTDNTDLILMREGAAAARRTAGGGDRSAGQVCRSSIATWPAWASRTCSRPSRRRSASGPACGPTTWCSTWPRSSTASRRSSPRRERDDRHAGQLSCSCSTAITPRSASWSSSSPKRWAFDASYAVTGQTYSRKVDAQVLDVLSGIAPVGPQGGDRPAAAASRKEIEEPFEADQIGTSAMAYKRNPMRSERICGLARFVISLQSSTAAHGGRRSGWSGRSTTAPTAGW